MTDAEFKQSTNAISEALLRICEQKGIDGQTSINLMSAGLMQTMANIIGPVATVERLRIMADHLEDDCIRSSAPSRKH